MKASIPDAVVRYLNIKPGDTLNWKLDSINKKHVVIVTNQIGKAER